MAIRETWCENGACPMYHEPVEHFYHASQLEDSPCESCGGQPSRLISTFAAPWTGDLTRFIDPGCDMHNQIEGVGHIQYRVKSSRLADGTPERVVIKTRQDQREFIKAEGLVDPFDMNPNLGNSDGENKGFDSFQSSSRVRGAWV